MHQYLQFKDSIGIATVAKDKMQIYLTTSELKLDDKAHCNVGYGDSEISNQYSWIFRRAESEQLPWLPIAF